MVYTARFLDGIYYIKTVGDFAEDRIAKVAGAVVEEGVVLEVQEELPLGGDERGAS